MLIYICSIHLGRLIPSLVRLPGESVSESQEADLLQWWSRPIPYDEANAIWTSYLGEARMPHGPRLDQVCTPQYMLH